MTKKLLSLALLFNGLIILAQSSPCIGGLSDGTYPCDGITLQAYISAADMDADEAQDSWGWTDPQDDKEYAIVALDNGTAFVDISDPVNPRYLGRLDSHSGGSNLWRDVKVYSNHAYIVSEVNDDGVQIFDLTGLRGLPTSPFGGSSVTFSEDGFLFIGDSGGGSNDGRAHNIVINEDSGFAYILGVNRSSNSGDGPLFVSLADPVNPVIVGEYGPSDYFHDAQVVNYDGPDTDYTGKEILIGCNEDNMKIVDVTDKSNPIVISTVTYTNTRYTHQGWFTEDKRFFIVGDEVDEEDFGFNTRTLVFDLQDLDNPNPQGSGTPFYTYFGATPAIDHNGYVRGNRFYLANYASGVRIIKIDGLYDATPSMTEVNFFDTYPGSESASFNGTWNVYPFFESGNLIASGFGNELVNGDGGLFILKDPLYDNVDPTVVCQPFTAVLNKVTGSVTVTASDIDGGTTDNFAIIPANFTLTGQTTFTCSDVGVHNITLEYEDDYGNTSSCVAIVTVEGETTEYQGGGSWTNGLPDIGSNAKISTDYNTSTGGNSSFSACTCEVDTNRTLTVAGGDYIQIEQDIDVNGTGSLIVEHEGIVVQTDPNASVNKDVTATINVEITTPVLSNRDFMVMGSPMDIEERTGVFTNAFLVLKSAPGNFMPHPGVPAGGTNFADDKLNNGKFWDAYTGAIEVGEGYIVRPQTSYTDPAVTSYDMTYELGTLNNGDVTMPIVFNGIGDNPDGSPNILANPYASPISATALINDNAVINEVYFWEHLTPPSTSIPGSNNMNFSMDDISMYNGSMGTPAANDPGTTTTPNGVISTGQGFAIKAFAGGVGNEVTFTNSMRLTSGNNTLRSPETEALTDRLLLEVRNADYGVGSYTGVAFNPLATEQLDDSFDTKRLATVVSLFSHLQDGSEQLGIQTMPELNAEMKIPLGFTTQVDVDLEYVLSIANAEGNQISNMIIYLVDNLLNTTTNLSQFDYNFRSGKDTYTNRFTILFESKILGPEENILDTIAIFPNPTNGVITISSPHTVIHDVEVYDIRGRRVVEVISSKDNQYTLNLESLETTIYFVKVHTEAGSTTKKIIKK